MKTHQIKSAILVSVLVFGFVFTVPAAEKTLLEVPVSAVSNATYLSSMVTRPWWNDAWKRRAPLLVSSLSEVPLPDAVIDAVVDFGEVVEPDEVRVITPWETEVPCACERKEGTKLELLFRTSLRMQENKPFLVYWGNPSAKRPATFSALSLFSDKEEIRMCNGAIDVTFDKYGRGGLIKRLHVVGSGVENELLERASGYAWLGFSLIVGKGDEWRGAAVTADNGFKKQVTFDSPNAQLVFTLYPEQPRLDYTYVIKPGVYPHAEIDISWACGGGCGYDEIVYPGAKGQPLVTKADIDSPSDCMGHPEYMFGKWISEGWYAIRDRRSREVVGMLFDREALCQFHYMGHCQAYGEACSLQFHHGAGKKTDPKAGSGAVVALRGSWEDVKTQYDRLQARPLVMLGTAQDYHPIPVKVPRLDRDFCADFNSHGWATAAPLKGTNWADGIACTLRAYGANVSRIEATWEDVEVSKGLHARLKASRRRKSPKPPFPEWEEGKWTGKNLRTETAAAHARGVAVNLWSPYVGGGLQWRDWERYPDNNMNFQDFDRELMERDYEVQALYAQCGVDAVFNAFVAKEGPYLPVRYWIKNNSGDYTKWKDPNEFFRIQDGTNEEVRKFYLEAKKRNPDKPVVLWNSENGEIGREMFMAEQVGSFDTCMVEILPGGSFSHVKHVAKRMRSLFDNQDGRTVHHHFYFYGLDNGNRMEKAERPFICGVNGFSYENITYGNCDREYCELIADFYRFAEYTRLGEKAAKMSAFKSVAVLRDTAAFRDDILNGRIGGIFAWKADQDNRVHAFAMIQNFCYDVVCNKYFTRKSLSRYPVVYVPHEHVFSDALAEELLAYVNAGGSAIIEGDVEKTGRIAALRLKDGETKTLGKGRIHWLARPLTDTIVSSSKSQKDLVDLVEELGAHQPYRVSVTNRFLTVDSVLQASSEGFLLGVCNTGKGMQFGKVSLDLPALKSGVILDVKNGVRMSSTNEFKLALDPGETAYYLIGDDKFTAIPSSRTCDWAGASVGSTYVSSSGLKFPVVTNFTQASAIEYTSSRDGRPVRITRSKAAKLDVLGVTDKNFDHRMFVRALEKASYLHLQAQNKDCDSIFADCEEELKSFLRRGGAILFDRVTTGEAAGKFLASVGVFDPSGSIRAGVGDGKAAWDKNVSTNHVLYGLNKNGCYGGIRYDKAYAKWDVGKQLAPFRATLDPKYAPVVIQEDVLGKGRVVFSQNSHAFTDWYENQPYGNCLISWFIGMPVSEHAKNVEVLRGGPGELLERKEER